MSKVGSMAELFIEDVNKEDSAIIELFGRMVNYLFKVISFAGIPFFIYVLFQFANVF